MSEIDYDEDYDSADDSDDVEMSQADDGSSNSDEEIEDTFDDFKVVPTKAKPKPYDVEYESLSPDMIDDAMRKDADHIVSIFSVDNSSALLLLRYLQWNKERLIEKYMDNPQTISIAAGLVPAPPPSPPPQSTSSFLKSPIPSAARRLTRRTASLASSPATKSPPPALDDQPFMCPICCDTEAPSPIALTCGHLFCSDCWSTYLSTKVREEGEHAIRCPASSCSVLTPDAFIQAHSSEDTYTRFLELARRHYVSSMNHLRFCPLPGCSNTLSCPAAASKASLLSVVPTVTCKAGHCFCFGCSSAGDHRPLICTVSKLWLKKCQDDSETANWIKSNTKECTKCQSTIEKNGGCNHMTCKKCRHEFCWVCMGPWSEHGTAWYNCNRFDEKSGIDARDTQSKSRASLERYLHYYNRWSNHEQSARLSLDLYAKTEKKMEEMQLTSDLTWIQVQFARKAVEEVERCRMTLKWTYAMAYYLESGNSKELFEDNQRDLEKAVEDLSELLESPIEPDTIATLRQKMTDKTVYVQKRNVIMLEDTAQGFLDGRWTWNVTIE